MSQGLKIGLIVGGAAIVGLFILRSSASAALPTTPTTTTGPTSSGLLGWLGLGGVTPPPAGLATTPASSPLGASPGAPTATSSSSGFSKLAGGVWGVDKAVIGGAVSGTKTVVKGIAGVATSTVSSVGHVLGSVLSIF